MRLDELAVSDSAELGENIRQWRMVRGLTAAMVADRAGVTISTLRKLEQGQGEGVRFGAVLAIARVLGFVEPVKQAFEPLNTDIGRLRAARIARKRVR